MRNVFSHLSMEGGALVCVQCIEPFEHGGGGLVCVQCIEPFEHGGWCLSMCTVY